jgi:hypothetical protein
MLLMAGRLAVAFAVASLVVGAGSARAFTMGEAVATTGMQGTLASSGSTGAAGTINSVKSALGKVTTQKQGQLDGAVRAWGGRGGAGSGWSLAASGKGWSAGGSKGWAVAATSGWGSAGKGAWASGGWSTN